MNEFTSAILAFLQAQPEIILFLSLVLGGLLGRLRIRNFNLGPIIASLLVAIVLGAITGVSLPGIVQSIFFNLFLFALGYSIGPQFFSSLSKSSLSQVYLVLVITFLGIASVLLMTAIFKFDIGTAAGLAAGSLNQSAMVASANEALGNLGWDESLLKQESSNLALAFAITLPFSSIATVLLLTVFLPKKSGKSLAVSAAEYSSREENVALADKSWQRFIAFTPLSYRTYELINPDYNGSTVARFEKQIMADKVRIVAIRRKGVILEVQPQSRLHLGDIIAISQVLSKNLPQYAGLIGKEVLDEDLLNFPVETVNLILTSNKWAGKSLGDLARLHMGRGVSLLSVERQGKNIALVEEIVLMKGDILRITGPKDATRMLADTLGYVEMEGGKTDIILLSLGVLMGILVGSVNFSVFGMSIGLGAGIGCLIIGLFFGWYRSRNRRLGTIPEVALQLIMDLGLVIFIAITGLNAGPMILQAWDIGGPIYFAQIAGAGLFCTLFGPILIIIFNKYTFKYADPILAGSLAGSRLNNPALTSVLEASESEVPNLGFTIPFAIGNILLTLAGPIIVAILSR